MRLTRIAVLLFALSAIAWGQTTEITYQGQLQSSSNPASGSFDFEFALFDGGGAQIGPTLTRNSVAVAGGIFSVTLDFGAGFPGATRFLEIRVRQAGGGAFTTLSPRQPVTSTPYSIKSLTAENANTAVNAANALTATNFAGNLAGDVSGTQTTTRVVRLQNQNVASIPPLDGQVLKFNSAANQWLPGTDNAGSGGGGGTITGVTPGTGLTGGGATGNVTLNIANGGVGTTQLADGSVTGAKIPAGQVVKNLNGIQDSVTLAAGSNISITPSGNTLTIASTGGGGGGGTITGVVAGTGLNGGGTSGSVTIGIGPGGVGTGQLAEGSVVDSKIVTVSGSKVTGAVADATTAVNSSNLAGIPASQYLQTNGNGSGLTNLNASSITTGTLANARLGQIPTANIADSAVTGSKIAAGQVVKSVNSLTDNVTLAAGANISITPSGNTLTIATTGGGGITGTGTPNIVPLWSGTNALANSAIIQSAGKVGIGNTTPFSKLDVDGGGLIGIRGLSEEVAVFGASTQGTGIYGNSFNGDAGLFDGRVTVNGQARISGNVGIGGPGGVYGFSVGGASPGPYPSLGFNGLYNGTSYLAGVTGYGGLFQFQNGDGKFGFYSTAAATSAGAAHTFVPRIEITSNGRVGIGTTNPGSRLEIQGGSDTGVSSSSSGTGVFGTGTIGISGQGNSRGIQGLGLGGGTGVFGSSNSGIGVVAGASSQGSVALLTGGTSFFKGDTTPLSAANRGSGTGIAIGTAGTLGYISAFDYGANQTGTLLLNNGGGRVGINTNSPDQALTINGNASKPGGGSWLAFSDERLKNIKGRFNGGLKAVMKLQPLRYEYKKDNLAGVRSEGEHIGFSAQEVEKVIPDAVTKTEQGIRLVNNDPIIWAMLNAIKEQQATIEKLTRQVRTLQRSRKRR